MRNAIPALVLAFGLSACGGSATQGHGQTTPQRRQGSGQGAARSSPEDTVGRTHDRPIAVCGPRASYDVVSHFRCPDGSMPLGGDLRAGQAARLGSTEPHMAGVGFADSHIVDLYQVPCGTGPIELFVCMYHCSEGERPF